MRRNRFTGQKEIPGKGALLLVGCLVVVMLGYQLFRNVANLFFVQANLDSLIIEIQTIGQEAFKNHLAGICSARGVELAAGDIQVSVDQAAGRYRVEVPFAWRFNLLLGTARFMEALRGSTPILPKDILKPDDR